MRSPANVVQNERKHELCLSPVPAERDKACPVCAIMHCRRPFWLAQGATKVIAALQETHSNVNVGRPFCLRKNYPSLSQVLVGLQLPLAAAVERRWLGH